MNKKNRLAWISLISLLCPLYAQSLEVGFGKSEITAWPGVPVGGYGYGKRRKIDFGDKHKHATWFAPSTGVLDPIQSKVMAMRSASKTTLIVSLDLVGVTARLKKFVLKRLEPLGIGENDLFLTATHTHSGLGSIAKNRFWQIAVMDKYQKKVFDYLVEKIFASIEQALQSMEPASLHIVTAPTQGLQRNRNGQPGHYDPNANFILVKDGANQVRGGIIHYTTHAIALDADNLKFSADVPGAIERHLAQQTQIYYGLASEPQFLFINGAQGDVSPSQSGESGMENIGRLFAEQTIPYFNRAVPLSHEIHTQVKKVTLDRPKINLKGCASNQANPNFYWFLIPRWLKLPLFKLMPKISWIGTIRFGDQLLIQTFPGEPTVSLGYLAQQNGFKAGFSHSWSMGLVNDHLGYFTTRGEYSVGGTEACGTLYGKDSGPIMVKKLKKLIDTL